MAVCSSMECLPQETGWGGTNLKKGLQTQPFLSQARRWEGETSPGGTWSRRAHSSPAPLPASCCTAPAYRGHVGMPAQCRQTVPGFTRELRNLDLWEFSRFLYDGNWLKEFFKPTASPTINMCRPDGTLRLVVCKLHSGAWERGRGRGCGRLGEAPHKVRDHREARTRFHHQNWSRWDQPFVLVLFIWKTYIIYIYNLYFNIFKCNVYI